MTPPAGADVAASASAADWLAQVRAAERRGELLEAFDLAERGLAQFPDDLMLRYRAVLALARAGATGLASRRYREYGLDGETDEDAAALGARLAKDVALAASGPERAVLARAAAERYEAIHRRTQGYFPGINAATMYLVAGAPDAARALAQSVLAALAPDQATTDEDRYYRLATQAEALLLLGRDAAVADALAAARRTAGGDLSAVAATRRQLRLVCGLTGAPTSVLEPLRAPAVIHYSGHIIAAPGATGRFAAAREATVAQTIAAQLDAAEVGFGFGALAAGADILFAEALLARGAELHVVLPFERGEFVATSVAPAGSGWTARFEACLAAARSVRYATEDAYLGDDQLFGYASQLAMGLAVLRARYLDAPCRQLAVWDEQPARGPGGTADDVALWRGLGLPQTIIPPGDARDGASAAAPASTPDGKPSGRQRRAMLFGDIKGFSKLTDHQMPAFVDGVLGAMATALGPFADAIEFRNTWGDGVFLVFADPRAAARCGLALQEAVAAVPLAACGLPGHLALRLGGHYGPVFPARDPILDRPNLFGAHVARAARMEPVTPPGELYVTEPFAAALALDPAQEFACDYVGRHPAAKDYGVLPMYVLARRR